LRTTDFFHKTKLCKFWQAGHCILDDKCRFAHTKDEIKKDAQVTDEPQQSNQQGNNCMPIPVMLNQIQFLLQQRERLQQHLQAQQIQQQMQSKQRSRQDYYQEQSPKDIYSGCATPEYTDFDKPPMQVLCPPTVQGPYQQPICGSCEESDETCDSRRNAWGSDSETDITPDPAWDVSDGSRTPDFPPVYGEEQVPLRMMPHMQRLPQLLAPLQQMSSRKVPDEFTENEIGDAIEHYAGSLEITQAPLPEEGEGPMDDIWQSNSDYQVKNTFISIQERSTYKPLRCVRSAAGRLTEMQNLP
jgi:hypothetical protein